MCLDSRDNTVLGGKIQIKIECVYIYIYLFPPPKYYTCIINASWTALCTYCIINVVIFSVPHSSEILPLETLPEIVIWIVWLHKFSFFSLTVYLFVGLMVMFLVLRTFHKLADVHGWTAFFQLPSCEEEDEDKEPIVEREPDDESPEAEQASIKPLDPSSQVSYNSINR